MCKYNLFNFSNEQVKHYKQQQLEVKFYLTLVLVRWHVLMLGFSTPTPKQYANLELSKTYEINRREKKRRYIFRSPNPKSLNLYMKIGQFLVKI